MKMNNSWLQIICCALIGVSITFGVGIRFDIDPIYTMWIGLGSTLFLLIYLDKKYPELKKGEINK